MTQEALRAIYDSQNSEMVKQDVFCIEVVDDGHWFNSFKKNIKKKKQKGK